MTEYFIATRDHDALVANVKMRGRAGKLYTVTGPQAERLRTNGPLRETFEPLTADEYADLAAVAEDAAKAAAIEAENAAAERARIEAERVAHDQRVQSLRAMVRSAAES